MDRVLLDWNSRTRIGKDEMIARFFGYCYVGFKQPYQDLQDDKIARFLGYCCVGLEQPDQDWIG